MLGLCVKVLFKKNLHPRIYSLTLEREEGGERDRQTDIDVRERYQSVASRTHPTKDQNHNLGTCSDQGSDPQPFVVPDNTPTNWATCPGLSIHSYNHSRLRMI